MVPLHLLDKRVVCLSFWEKSYNFQRLKDFIRLRWKQTKTMFKLRFSCKTQTLRIKQYIIISFTQTSIILTDIQPISVEWVGYLWGMLHHWRNYTHAIVLIIPGQLQYYRKIGEYSLYSFFLLYLCQEAPWFRGRAQDSTFGGHGFECHEGQDWLKAFTFFHTTWNTSKESRKQFLVGHDESNL